MEGFHVYAVDHVGFDYGSLLQAAGGLATGIATGVEEDDAKAKLSGDEKKKVEAAIAADQATANALAKADVSAQLKSKSASLDAAAAQAALAGQDRVAALLSADGQVKRAAVADAALAVAQKNSFDKPSDGYRTALVKAWNTVANKAHGAAIVQKGDDKGKGDKESWWTRRVLGPIPGYGVVAGGAGLAGALGYAVKRLFF